MASAELYLVCKDSQISTKEFLFLKVLFINTI